jgi:hypothetical protein
LIIVAMFFLYLELNRFLQKMKKFILAIFISAVAVSASAQDMKDIILTMPESIIYGLEASDKNLLASGLDDTTRMVVNRGRLGQIIRQGVSPDFISLKSSDAGTTEIKLLPLVNESQIICVIKTVCANICDSQIQFYTTRWVPIAQADLFPKVDKEWFLKPGIDKDSQEFRNAYAALDMSPVRMELLPADTSLKVYFGIDKYLNKEDYKKIEPFLIDNPRIFYWDKSSYK